jgi:ribosome-associated translation inhibitor RaiA
VKTNVLFKDFEALDHLESYVQESAESHIGKFETTQAFDTKVIIGMFGARSNHREFECELIVRSPHLGNPLVVRKHNPDFYSVVSEAMRSVEKILRRKSKMRTSERRHQTLREIDLVALENEEEVLP